VLTTGATMANLVALAAARNWWGERHGVDVEKEGVGRLAPAVILSSGYLHPSAIQAVGMLGFGRGNIRRLARNEVGRLDLVALERELRQAATPAIVIANAGEVNAGDFDPIADVADLCERYSAWLHVDGAFGLFARLTPSTRALTESVERADSVISDGHKWLNVPYDCGFAFVREMERVPRALNVGAPYLPSADDPHPNFGFASPENSRRACALAVWATLRAYGRTGYREMVERHVRLARHLAECVDASPQLERLADVPLNIVCFRAHPPGFSEERLNELNTRVDDALRAGRARVRGHNHLRREGGAMIGDRQLADGYFRRRAHSRRHTGAHPSRTHSGFLTQCHPSPAVRKRESASVQSRVWALSRGPAEGRTLRDDHCPLGEARQRCLRDQSVVPDEEEAHGIAGAAVIQPAYVPRDRVVGWQLLCP